VFLRLEKPFPWGLERSSDLHAWQIEYLQFAKLQDSIDEDRVKKMFADYIGSYFDPKRAQSEMKRLQTETNSDNDYPTSITYVNQGFGKEPSPVIKFEDAKQEATFNDEFDKAMRVAFGESYREEKVIVKEEDDDSSDASDVDEVIIK